MKPRARQDEIKSVVVSFYHARGLKSSVVFSFFRACQNEMSEISHHNISMLLMLTFCKKHKLVIYRTLYLKQRERALILNNYCYPVSSGQPYQKASVFAVYIRQYVLVHKHISSMKKLNNTCKRYFTESLLCILENNTNL